jgi:hypothetical protein
VVRRCNGEVDRRGEIKVVSPQAHSLGFEAVMENEVSRGRNKVWTVGDELHVRLVGRQTGVRSPGFRMYE